MASTSETGHAKNVANFEDLIGFCAGYGPAYNPSRPTLTLAALNTLFANANTTLLNLKTAKTVYDIAQNDRESLVKPLKSLATRIIHALVAAGASVQTVDDARTVNSRIQGKRAKVFKKVNEEPDVAVAEPPKMASISQQSYDKIIDNFNQLVQAISAEPRYAPNENDLKVSSLISLMDDIKNKNAAFIAANTNLSNARITRDEVLYAEGTGMIDIVREIKSYVKSVFGTLSPQYKQISSLKFARKKI